ncbi:MAG TPA: MBL fold metallo-hydrolase [Anaerolineaceae bacterium]|nr:MBL fold metallo-hydrolase [Anaerolineaceae bacterium]
MQLTFLGTSAANAYPEAFCACPNCIRARQQGGKSLRKRSAALVDERLLIDLGPDIHAAAQQDGIPLTGVRWCLQTHAHADHFDPSHLLSRSPGYGTFGAPRLHFYASRGTLSAAQRLLERDCAPYDLLDARSGTALNLEIHPIEAGRPFDAGPYRVFPFTANHDPAVESLLYAIQSGDRCLFYGTDTAALPEETWRAFHAHKLRFDLVILDHTYGPEQPASDHLNARQVIEHVARLSAEGLLLETARVFATHIAHEGNPPHEELAGYAAAHGYEVAYDGLTLIL